MPGAKAKRYSRAVTDHDAAVDTITRKEGHGWRFYVGIVALALFAIFVLQNSQDVEINILFVETTTPLFLAILIAGGLGGMIGWALPHVRRSRRVERERRD